MHQLYKSYRNKGLRLHCLFGLWLLFAVPVRGQSLRILDTIDGVPPGDMVHHYLQTRIDSAWRKWMTGFEERMQEGDSTHYAALRDQFVERLGGFPDRTPLNARRTGVLEREGYTVEKILFESQPAHYVTALFFLPDSRRFKRPVPGVLIPCGHYRASKAHDEYQAMGALLSLIHI